MIKYNNRGIKAYVALLLCLRGSVVPDALPATLFAIALSLVLCLTRNDGGTAVAGIVWSNEIFAIQIFGIVLSFLLVTRTNMAIGRYCRALQGLEVMTSKWLDGYMHLVAFINAELSRGHDNKDRPGDSSSSAAAVPEEEMERMDRLLDWRDHLAHWFSLMATFAVANLRGREGPATLEEEPLSTNEFSAEKLREKQQKQKGEETSDAESVGAMSPKAFEGESTAASPQAASASGSPPSRRTFKRSSSRFGLGLRRPPNLGRLFQTESSVLGRGDEVLWPHDPMGTGIHDKLHYLGSSSTAERVILGEAHDKVLLVSGWICESVTRAACTGLLKVPPPIVTRIYQEVSNGMLAYNDALHMVVIVPFPFPFAQMLTLLLLGWTVLAPFMVLQFTRHVVFSPILTSMIVFGFIGIDSIARELENPCGDDANDLPLLGMHKDFNNNIKELMYPPPHLIPEGTTVARERSRAGQRVAPSFDDPKSHDTYFDDTSRL
mmetsp:Transcript_105021/g.296759  ORF Transcript_105021/g.296759 Transcript_105021/m.296759 type:complete len:492 (-) Transcript_105021:62-1537(-)|eukprot:CAMPEP_0168393974 /NCGR_PEP_ID=MMETSP0228-20121227/19292_1 /TAXON_ID=133427 /ORGANISM="Protoceratium reticulatum, Strain CCCM 535 (=CCMP 1889)" /LENGTH=491 /DNA_ID=CAMNT_0008407367 /DNA_START=47 /DNA_END=1522 /DNA_ORIENTATION=+